ncbi:MAG: TauD/TfdA family dioxygenase [Bacteroidota bacterium]
MNMKIATIETALELPLVVELDNLTAEQFAVYYEQNKDSIQRRLHLNGAVKFRGVQVGSTDDFQALVDVVSTRVLNYIDGNSPRTKLTGNVYTSTEYDQTQRITMHNELSYSAAWPKQLYFSCLIPSETGGETLLADSRTILERMNPEIVQMVQTHGIKYIRNLHGGTGMGPSWQDTFETDDRRLVEKYCRVRKTEYEWRDNGSLRLVQFSPGVLQHEVTGESVWFNQVDQFHPSHLGEELYEIMQAIYERPEDFPMYVEFGDGSPFPEDMIREILDTIDSVTVAPVWGRNEFLMIDNELVSHGRNPYTGNRKVLVAMS